LLLRTAISRKSSRGLLLRNYKIYEDTHGIYKLLKTISKTIKIDDKILKCGKMLDKHYLPPRYPNMWPSGAPHEFHDLEDAEEAINCAKEILELVKRNIK